VLLRHVLRALCAEAGIHTIELPQGLRIARRGDLHFAFNYDRSPLEVPARAEAEFLIGERNLPPAGVAVWRNRPAR
jgi:beta-galactosidase